MEIVCVTAPDGQLGAAARVAARRWLERVSPVCAPGFRDAGAPPLLGRTAWAVRRAAWSLTTYMAGSVRCMGVARDRERPRDPFACVHALGRAAACTLRLMDRTGARAREARP